jgi:hypothetical protein
MMSKTPHNRGILYLFSTGTSIMNLNTGWKPLSGYENDYEISATGHIRRRFGKRLIVKPTTKGVARVKLTRYLGNDALVQRQTYKLAELVAGAFLPPPPSPLARLVHKNGDKQDCSAANLTYVLHGSVGTQDLQQVDPEVQKLVNRGLIKGDKEEAGTYPWPSAEAERLDRLRWIELNKSKERTAAEQYEYEVLSWRFDFDVVN